MPFPCTSQALSRFTVVGLTRVLRVAPCVRQLADWRANVIAVRGRGAEQLGGPRHGSDFRICIATSAR